MVRGQSTERLYRSSPCAHCCLHNSLQQLCRASCHPRTYVKQPPFACMSACSCKNVSLSWPGIIRAFVVDSSRLSRCVLLNHATWSRASQPCGIPSRHYITGHFVELGTVWIYTYVLNNMAVVAHKVECATISEIDLHSDQA